MSLAVALILRENTAGIEKLINSTQKRLRPFHLIYGRILQRASLNFISADIVAKLALPVSMTDTCGVQMGSGQAVKGEGTCREV